MDDPWKKYNQINDKAAEVTDPWKKYNPPVEQVDPFKQSIINTKNRIHGISDLIKAGTELALSPVFGYGTKHGEKVRTELAKGQEQAGDVNRAALSDIGNTFAKTDWSVLKPTNIAKAFSDFFALREGEGQGDAANRILPTIFELPGGIIESMVGSTFKAVSGVGIDSGEVKALPFDEHKRATKELMGNAIAAVVAPGVSKLMAAGFELPATRALGASLTGENIAAASTQQVAKLAAVQPRIGAIGRAMIDDFTAGAASGMAQGAVANANDPNVIASMATGLLFAPIGAVIGWYRGVKQGGGRMEDAISKAQDVKYWRSVQDVTDANVEGAAVKVMGILEEDDILWTNVKHWEKSEVPVIIRDLRLRENDRNALSGRSSATFFRRQKDDSWATDHLFGPRLPLDDIIHFERTGELPKKVNFVEETYVTGGGEELINLKSANPSQLQRQNEEALDGFEGGKGLTVYGFRMQRGQEIPGTGRFYATTREHAELYGSDLPEKTQIQKLVVHKLEFEKALKLPHGHYEAMKLVRQRLDEAENYRDSAGIGYAEARADWFPEPDDPTFPSFEDWAKQQYVNIGIDEIDVNGLRLTLKEARALIAAENVKNLPGHVKQNAGLHLEAGYQLMDKILARAAKTQGYDAIIYDNGINGSQVVDISGRARAGRAMETQAELTYQVGGIDYVVEKNVGDMIMLRPPIDEDGTRPPTSSWLTVPRNKIKDLPMEYKVVPNPTEIKSLYENFKKSLKDDEPFEASVINFAQENGLTDNINELVTKFSRLRTKELVDPAELATLQSLRDEYAQLSVGRFFGSEYELAQAARRGNFFYTNEFGKLKIRDTETGAVLTTANNSQEALEYIEKMGPPPNATKFDAGAKVTTDGVGIPVGPGMGQHLGDSTEPEWFPRMDNITSRMARFDLDHSDFSSAVARMEGYTETAIRSVINTMNSGGKTNVPFIQEGGYLGKIRVDLRSLKSEDIPDLKTPFTELEIAKRQTLYDTDTNFNEAAYKKIDMFVRSGKNRWGYASRFTDDEAEMVGLGVETQSIPEMLAPDGLQKGKTVEREAVELANFMQDNDVDGSLVLMYRRAQMALHGQFKNIAEKNAFEQFKLNKQSGAMDLNDAMQFFEKESADYKNNPAFAIHQGKIHAKFRPSAEFQQTLDMFENIFSKKDGAFQAMAANRIKLALESPDTHGLSRADFIAKHKLSADQVKLMEMVDEAYAHYGKKFGIDDSRTFRRFMNHYRQFGDILDTYVIGDFEKGIMDGPMREFASSMIRTGELKHYSLNPIDNLQAYIRAGSKKKLYAAIESARVKLDEELAKIPDTNLRIVIKTDYDNYVRDISGQQRLSKQQAQSFTAQHLSTIARIDDKNGGVRNLTRKEIIAELSKPDVMDSIFALSGAANLGGRVMLAIRDSLDVWNKFYIRHGGERLWDMAKMPVSKQLEDGLVASGEIARPSITDYYDVGQTSAPISAAARELAEFGVKTSLQPHLFMKNQVKVYMSTLTHTERILQQLGEGKLKKIDAYEKIGVSGYDISTQRIFDAHVQDNNVNAAARLIAREETRMMVGDVSRGNQAPIANTGGGKLFGQFASWGMANRSVMQNIMTRGTEKEMRRAQIRYATTIMGVTTAGAALGLNLGGWLVLPTSFMVTGGPVLQGAQAVGGAIKANLGGSEASASFANREAARGLAGLLPGANVVRDVYKAGDLVNNGEGFGGRVIARGLGIGVNEEDRSLMDIIRGNQPVKWDGGESGWLERIKNLEP